MLIQWGRRSGAPYDACFMEECADLSETAERIRKDSAQARDRCHDFARGDVSPGTMQGAGIAKLVRMPLVSFTARDILTEIAGGWPADAQEPGGHPILRDARYWWSTTTKSTSEVRELLVAARGARAESADDGRAALERLEKQRTGRIRHGVMDLRMPRDGWLRGARASRMLKRDDMRRIPIIALTADVFEADETDASAGVWTVFSPSPVSMCGRFTR